MEQHEEILLRQIPSSGKDVRHDVGRNIVMGGLKVSVDTSSNPAPKVPGYGFSDEKKIGKVEAIAHKRTRMRVEAISSYKKVYI